MYLHTAVTGLARKRGASGSESPTTEMAKRGGPTVPLVTSPRPVQHELPSAGLDVFALFFATSTVAGQGTHHQQRPSHAQ